MIKLLLIVGTAIGILTMPGWAVRPTSAQEEGRFLQCTCTGSPRAVSMLGQAGPALRANVAVLLEREPRAADEMVCAARHGSQAQKFAIGQGIADAARFFSFCRAVPTETCRASEGYLRQAMICADELTRTAFDEIIGHDIAADITPTAPVFIPGIGGGRVSPSAPNSC